MKHPQTHCSLLHVINTWWCNITDSFHINTHARCIYILYIYVKKSFQIVKLITESWKLSQGMFFAWRFLLPILKWSHGIWWSTNNFNGIHTCPIWKLNSIEITFFNWNYILQLKFQISIFNFQLKLFSSIEIIFFNWNFNFQFSTWGWGWGRLFVKVENWKLKFQLNSTFKSDTTDGIRPDPTETWRTERPWIRKNWPLFSAWTRHQTIQAQ